MREGTATRTAAQISEEAARMGGSLTVSVGGDSTTIGGDVLTEFGPQMVALVADVVAQPEVPRVRAAAAQGEHGPQPRRARSASRSSSRCRSSAP